MERKRLGEGMERKEGGEGAEDYAHQMYWDPNYHLLLQTPNRNPPMVQNPPNNQNSSTNPNPGFDHLLFPNTNSNLIYPGNNNNTNGLGFNGFSSLGFGAASPHDQILHHDQLAAALNRLSISNNGIGNGISSNQRTTPSFMPSSSSSILGGGGGGFNTTLEQDYWQMLNQYALLMAAQQYMRRTNPTTSTPNNWNRNSFGRSTSGQTIHGDQFGYVFNQMRSTSSHSQRNGISSSRGSSRSKGGGRQEKQLVNLMSSSSATKDQRVFNGDARPSYYSAPLEELRGQIAFLAREHVGCRFLQKKIEEGKAEEIDMIFNEVMDEGHDHLRDLMVDQFGTDFIQKLVEGTNREGLTRMLDLVMTDEGRLKEICIDQHGSRAMQKLLERIENREQHATFMRLLKRITIPVGKSQPGHYVIQACFKHFSPDCIKGVLDLVLDNLLLLAKEKFGCCVVQDCFRYGYAEAKERVVADVTEHARVLSEDAYGNYVVQFIIGLKIPRVTAEVLGQLQGYFVNLSMNKHGSNVVEKSLREGEEHANMIINEMMNSPEFLNVCQSPYGNYVAQSALAVSKGSVRNALVNLVRSYYPHLHSHLYGKRVLDKTKSRHRA